MSHTFPKLYRLSKATGKVLNMFVHLLNIANNNLFALEAKYKLQRNVDVLEYAETECGIVSLVELKVRYEMQT